MKKVIWVLIFLAIFVEVIFFLPKDLLLRETSGGSSLETSENNSLAEEHPAVADQTMRGVHLVEARQEKKEWELWADRALGMRDAKQWTLDVVKAHFYGENGVKFKIVGEYGKVEADTKDLMVSGNVVIKSTNGYIFRTDKVKYLAEGRKLDCPGEVRVEGPKDSDGNVMTLRGDKMLAHLVGSVIDLSGHIAARKQIREDKLAVIRSETVELSSKIKMAHFRRHVKIDVGGSRITGSEARFLYDNEKDFIKNVVVNGNVRVSDKDKWATSKNLKVNFDTDRYVFSGDPRVMQDNDVLVGEEIVFLDGGKRVEVQGARAKVEENSLERGQ